MTKETTIEIRPTPARQWIVMSVEDRDDATAAMLAGPFKTDEAACRWIDKHEPEDLALMRAVAAVPAE